MTSSDANDTKNIIVVNKEDECEAACEEFLRHVGNTHVIGFDCEWVAVNNWGQLYERKEKALFVAKKAEKWENGEEGEEKTEEDLQDELRLSNCYRDKVSLLQMAAYDGFSVLVRLILFQKVPKALQDVLEDVSLIKVGVNIFNDSSRMYRDWGILLNSWIDLRFMHKDLPATEDRPDICTIKNGLKALATLYCDKDDNIKQYSHTMRYSDWNQRELREDQMHYAAQDARIAARVYAGCGARHLTLFNDRESSAADGDPFWDALYKYVHLYMNCRFDSDRYMSLKMGGDGAVKRKQKEVEDSASDVDLDLEALDDTCTSRDAVKFYMFDHNQISPRPFVAISPLLLQLMKEEVAPGQPAFMKKPINIEFERNGKKYRFRLSKTTP